SGRSVAPTRTPPAFGRRGGGLPVDAGQRAGQRTRGRGGAPGGVAAGGDDGSYRPGREGRRTGDREDEDVTISIEEATERAAEIQTRVSQVVLGQDEVLRHLLVALLAGRHVLLEGVPGVAKTLAVRSLSRAVSARF